MAEKRVIELEVQDNSKTLKQQYKEAVVELQRVAQAYGETSQQAAEAAKRAAGLKDQIEDTNDAIKAFKGEGAFNAVGKAVSSVASGFSAVEGAMGLVGIESEKLQETMLRVQSVMALAQGLEGLEDAGRAFKQLGSVAVNALKGVRGALIATGIGALVVALGTIVAYWDDIKAAVSGVTSEQEELNKKAEANVTLENEKLTALNGQDNILKLQGLSEKQILQLKLKQIDLVIAATEEQIKQNQITQKAQEEATLRNFKIAKQVIASITKIALIPVTAMIAQVDLLIKGANYVSEALGGGKLIDVEPLKEANKFFDQMAESGAKLLFDPEEVKAEGEKVKKETEKQLLELKNQKAGYQIALKEIDKRGIEDAKNAKKDEADAKLAAEKEYNDKLRAYYDAIEQERQGQIEDAKEKELQALDNKFEALYKAADDANQSDKELLIKHQQEIADINLKYDLLAQEEAKKTADELARIEKERLDEIDKANKEAAEKDIALKKRNRDFAIEMTLSGLSTIASLTELFGKKSEKAARRAFQIQKAANMATAIISTYQSATAAYASQFTPVPDPSSPVRGAIAAGMAVAAGLVNVAKIASQKFEGGGSSGGGGAPAGAGGGGAVMTPNFNVIGSSGVNQLAQIQQQPTRAYVVSGDVANGLSLERNRLQNATL